MVDGNDSVVVQVEKDRWLHFANPVRIIVARSQEEVLPALEAVENAACEGLYSAGFVAYEAAPALDAALRVHEQRRLPLVWFGLYSVAEELSDLPRPEAPYTAEHWEPSLSRDQYYAAIARIKEYIAAGDSYQVNYTIRLQSTFTGSPYALFHAIVAAQEASHCAFVNAGPFSICSASPELFFCLEGDRLVSRPMKGTAGRGLTCKEDDANAKDLQCSEKNRAENIMVVDMIRNDMARIAQAGSVAVKSTFDIERYPTVLQMTSTVQSQTKASFFRIFQALFPCASITGAPKVRTMQIINELEFTPRGVYTGTIGYVAPNRRACFNVAIRTVTIDRDAGVAEYGVGGGVVWDSAGAMEYEECLTKTLVLTRRDPEFELLETVLWTPDEGYFLREKHLARMQGSAGYFDFRFAADEMERRLDEYAGTFGGVTQRVRLCIAKNGAIRLEARPIDEKDHDRVLRVGLARRPIDSSNRFLYHKTTNRLVYDDARAERPDCEDVILWNERGEITESTIANIVIEINGQRLTPPVESGLLAGVFRAHLLEEAQITEGSFTVAQLRMADRIFLVNSVRKWMPVVLVD